MRCLGIDIGLRHLGICELICLDTGYVIHTWLVIDVIEHIPHCKNIKNIHISDLQIVLEYLFNNVLHHDYVQNNIDHVLLELQPNRTNNKIKIFANMLYNCFCNLRNTIRFGQVLTSVQFLHGKVKYDKRFLEHFNISCQKRNYKQRKELSVILTKNILQDYCIFYSLPKYQKKFDDMADAFLLAFYFALYGNQ
jgi:hypothetical protein